MKNLLFATIALVSCVAFAAFDPSSGTLTPAEKSAVNFLDSIPYQVEDIEKLDILNPKHTFMFVTKNGDICLGNTLKKTLNCKTKDGADGFSFDGDAD